MFQTPRIFTNDAGIYYYGEVLRTSRVRRLSIREVPLTHRNPDELYYRFVIREWIPLARPILPKESGFVHAYTNLFLLENTEYVPELLLKSEEEYRFYMELKRRTGKALDSDVPESEQGFELGEVKVIFENGKIFVIQRNKIISECEVKEFSRHPTTSFRNMIKRLR
jgi:hypothetical protein